MTPGWVLVQPMIGSIKPLVVWDPPVISRPLPVLLQERLRWASRSIFGASCWIQEGVCGLALVESEGGRGHLVMEALRRARMLAQRLNRVEDVDRNHLRQSPSLTFEDNNVPTVPPHAQTYASLKPSTKEAKRRLISQRVSIVPRHPVSAR